MGKIGIRREDKNKWERRAPLAPSHVAQLVSSGIEIAVQPSEIRIFTDDEYVRSGADLSEELSGCGLVLGIKEIPAEYIRSRAAYLFFSHVAKGQPHNMEMLGRILRCRATLLDYEQIVDRDNRRLVFFGSHAGAAGLLETLYALGKRLEWERYATPLSAVCRPLELVNLDQGRQLLVEIGQRIRDEGVGAGLEPLVVGFVGYGNVSSGAQELFDLLPHEEIAPENLKAFMSGGRFSATKLYKVVFEENDIVAPVKPNQPFQRHDYYRCPENYRGRFDEYLPHLTALINCIYWERRYPRLVTREWLRSVWSGPTGAIRSGQRLRVIGDITCDIEGSIECTLKATDPGTPVYTYDPSSDSIVDGWEGNGVVVMAIDTLPSEVPREASLSFGDMLLPYIPELSSADFSVPFDELELGEVLKRSIIVYRGNLRERYRDLERHLNFDR